MVLISVTLLAATVAAQEVLPRPEPPFKGKIGRTVKDSTPDFPKGVEAPKGAPNILLILTDDVGFGASSPFGGPIQTPNFQRLADSGIRYNTFHTTALCSPTRSALITGRNHHTNASGVITEMATGVTEVIMGKRIVRILPKNIFVQADCLRIIFDTQRIVCADIADCL
jgi:hypothetical protein